MNPLLGLEDQRDHHHRSRVPLTFQKLAEPSGAHEHVVVHHDGEAACNGTKADVSRLGLVQEVRLEDEPDAVSEAISPEIPGPLGSPSRDHHDVVGLRRMGEQSVQALRRAGKAIARTDDDRAGFLCHPDGYATVSGARTQTLRTAPGSGPAGPIPYG